MKQRTIAGALAAVVGALTLSFGMAAPAHARGEDAARIGTYLGAGTAAYGLAKGDSTLAILGTGVGLLSYSAWQHEMSRRHRREHSWREYSAYRSNWYRHHRHGHRYHHR